ncbi:hypothetical protein LJC46_09730 [Desulfovibrio sp. OttesenSCG-928-G15]|nr:hypothetical protein [Desulfovibrio sp. OttesenSCG-928-G15]
MFNSTPENSCKNCRHWLGSRDTPVIARVANTPIRVGQCIGQEENDDAPFADLDNGAEAFVFTPPNGRCRAYAAFTDDEVGITDLCAYNGVRPSLDFPVTL